MGVYQGKQAFKVECFQNCTKTEKERKNFFEKASKITNTQIIDPHIIVEDSDSNLDNITMPIQDLIEVNMNVSSNKNERSHNFMLKTDYFECFEEKCDVCRNNSCCNYYGLFPFDFFATKCFLFSLLAVDQFTNIFN